MNIALDYDDTYTKDPMFWDSVITNAIATGHDIRFVTRRYASETYGIVETAQALHIPIMFCSRKQKQEVCDSMDFVVDVWIDDMPIVIPTRMALKATAVDL